MTRAAIGPPTPVMRFSRTLRCASIDQVRSSWGLLGPSVVWVLLHARSFPRYRKRYRVSPHVASFLRNAPLRRLSLGRDARAVHAAPILDDVPEEEERDRERTPVGGE